MGLFTAHLPTDPLWLELTGLSDRTAAIVATALMEDKLGDAIRARLLQDKDTLNKLFKPTGAIGSLGTKADLAFLLGIFSKETRDDIAVAAGIRNKFAHWSTSTHFEIKDIRKACEEITFLRRLPDADRMGWTSVASPFPNGYARYSFIAFAVLVSDILMQLAESPTDYPAMPNGL